jgi:hypothetical protein
MEKIMNTFKSSAIVLGMASAITFAVLPASAGPLMPNQAAVKAAAPDQGTDVQWRRHRGWGPGIGIGAGLAAGALIGAAVASRPYYDGYYGGYGYYDAPVYATPYAYEPVYPAYGYRYGYGYGYSGNACEEGYRRVQCSAGGGY